MTAEGGRARNLFLRSPREQREIGFKRELHELFLGGILLVALASCAPRLIPPAASPAPAPAPPAVSVPTPSFPNALAAGLSAASLPTLDAGQAARAQAAFRISCPQLLKRADPSGLTASGDWRVACDAAAVPDPAFFARHFEAVEVGGGTAFATGYFEPEIAGSRVPLPGHVPVYRKPPELLDANPLTGAKGRGMLANGAYTLFHDRAAIEDGVLAGRGLEMAWAADPIDLFFLHIQGSGRLRMPDGSVMRIGYDGQNGREYVAIGRTMKERGLLGPGQTSMQGIKAWLRTNPEEGRAIMRENKSYIFFRELTGPGPIGAMNVPVTPRATVAADPAFVPLGAPVVLDMDNSQASGLWIAQDTGGAIKGANRFDTFWGAGPQAALTAGGMQAEGRALLLLPKGTLARIRR